MEEKQTDLAFRILQNCRNELYSLFPYLDGAFAVLPWKVGARTAFDGAALRISPRHILSLYRRDPAAVRRGYLHVLLHCLFLHPFQPQPPEHWNLACDMAVEQMMAHPRLAVPNPVREDCLSILGKKARSPAELLPLLDTLPYDTQTLEAAFRFDDHSLWHPSAQGQAQWTRALAYAAQNRRAGTKAGQCAETLTELPDSPYDYRRFLRRFAVPREELILDPDSFDYIYYHLGLTRYGNLPLIEPLEYREGRKLETLVIAIDTSGSCSVETVRQFLSDTYAILCRQENFFRRMEVYLIQCDCLVQDVSVIRSAEEWHNYSRAITIQGRGGTDFTPVFRYVEQQRRAHRLKNLKALLYFTDGDGVYPRTPTDYETAFVFLEKTDKMDVVPKWATKLLVR